MKKILATLLAATMLFSLAACTGMGSEQEIEPDSSSNTTVSSISSESVSKPDSIESENNSSTATGSSTSAEPDSKPDSIESADITSSAADSSIPSSAATPADTSGGNAEPSDSGTKVLIAYFSATGTTKKLAEYAADAAGADLYRIVPAEPYTTADLNYNVSDCRANTEMNDPSCRPAISGSVTNMADYDIVFIGYPIWWGEAPRIVSTFIESYDFSGKTVVTFSTSGGSGHNDRSIKALADGANWITGTRLKSNSSNSEIAAWINGLDLDISAK